VHDHFNITADQEITEDGIRSAILGQLKLGSREDEIYNFLKRRKIGGDPLSAYYKCNEKQPFILCQIDYDPKTFGFVKESYLITFELAGSPPTLQEVKVSRKLTGL
jgi:hypothetical protein